MGAGLGVGQGVVVLPEVEAAGGGDGLELMVRELAAEVAPGSRQRVTELIIGIIHLIDAMDRPQTALVEARIVRHQRQALKQRRDLLPDIRKHGRAIRIAGPQPMHALAEPLVILRLRMDERIERIHHFPAPHHDHAHAADAAGLLVRRLEVYGCEVRHFIL